VNLVQKIAAAAGALTLTATGIAAAASSPDAADTGLTRAEEHVDVDLPVAGATARADHADDGANDDAEDLADDDATEDATDDARDDTSADGSGPTDTHGAEVSAVAQTEFATGREHGEAVSTVARGDHGPDAGGTEDDAAVDDDTDDEADVDADTDADADTEDDAAAAAAAGGHGRK
jgi:hypothetical protein